MSRRLRRFLLILILPLSALPFTAFLFINKPAPAANPIHYGVRASGEATWPAPSIVFTRADYAYKSPPLYHGQIPILLYHGINNDNDPATDIYSVTPKRFSEQMALIQHLGYHTISIAQYLAWREGKHPKLPSRPILLTFDDARFDSYRGADQILKQYGMRATIFVIVGQVQLHNMFYCTWGELWRMQASGRWDIQFHANMGHVRIPVNAKGGIGAYYAAREYINGHRETLDEYARRVQNDINTGLATMTMRGFTDLHTMAMPFGEYGQHPVEPVVDHKAKDRLSQILEKDFTSVFIQSGFSFTPYSSPTRAAIRKEIRHATTIKQLYSYLYGADPVVIAARVRACQPPLLTWDPINAKCYR